jgi:predicted amidophosphoribosyltransferase
MAWTDHPSRLNSEWSNTVRTSGRSTNLCGDEATNKWQKCDECKKAWQKTKAVYCELCGDEIMREKHYWIHVNTNPRHIAKPAKQPTDKE